MSKDLTAPSAGSAKPGPADSRVCVGVIVSAHGIRGQVRVKSFTEDPEWLDAYGPLEDEKGTRSFDLQVIGRAKGVMICAIDGVQDRTDAEKLRGVELYIDREALPDLDEDEFYHSDLIGLTARFADGTVVGVVSALHDFGAGDVMEIKGLEGGVAVIPFTRASVPEIHFEAGEVVVEPLIGALEGPITPATTGSRKRSAPKGQGGARKTPREADPESQVAPEEEEWPEEDWH